MKYWKKEGDEVINLHDGSADHRVLSVEKRMDDTVEFMEMCDMYFVANYTREEAIEALEEAIEWLKS